jgi:glycosyltransferase involved in cell wall biosynthesis
MSESLFDEKQQPLVSVIMPAYNAEAYIAEAISSLIGQSYQNWELVVVNDGSKDNTEAEILKFLDPRIRYFKQENKGVSAARNLALDNIKGNFMCFLDADDAYPTKSIEARLLLFQQSDEIEFVDGTVVLKDKNLKEIRRIKKHHFSGNPHVALIKLDNDCFFGPSWMIRYLPNEKVYRFDERITHSEYLMFYISVSKTGLYAATQEDVLYYRVSGVSAMSNLKGLENGYAQVLKDVLLMPISLQKIRHIFVNVLSVLCSVLTFGNDMYGRLFGVFFVTF